MGNRRNIRNLYTLAPVVATLGTGIFAAGTALLLATSPVLSQPKDPSAPPPGPVESGPRIGAILPLTGRYQAFGEKALAGIRTALEGDAASRGGPTLFVADSGGDPERGAQAVRELAVQDQVVGIVGPLLTRVALSAAPVAGSLGIPLISLSADQRVLSPSPADPKGASAKGWVFRRALTDEQQVAALVEFMYGRAGFRKFALLTPQTPYGEKMSALFRAELDRMNSATLAAWAVSPRSVPLAPPSVPPGEAAPAAPLKRGAEPAPAGTPRPALAEVVAAVTFPGGVNDHGPQIRSLGKLDRPWTDEEKAARILDKKYKIPPTVLFEALFIPADYLTMGTLAPQLAFYDISPVVLLGTDAWNSPELPDQAEQWIEGGIFASGFFPGRASTETRRFNDRHFLAFGEDPTPLQAQAYDAALALRRGAEAGARDREAMRAWLASLRGFPGAEGPLTTDPRGDIAQSVTLLQVAKGGSFSAASLPARLPSFVNPAPPVPPSP